MSEGKSNTGLLVIIALGVIAIAGVLLYQSQQKSPSEQVADSVSDAAEDIGDAAEDAADGN